MLIAKTSRYTPKIKTPHELQTIRITRKLLYKAYGLAVSKRLANAKGEKSVATKQGAGAVFIMRKFDSDCVDADTHNIKKRVETPTETKYNPTIRAETLFGLLMRFDDKNISDKTQLSDVVNYMVVHCGFEDRIQSVGALKATASRVISDRFPVIQAGKKHATSVTFSAKAFWERTVTFESKHTYTLLFAQDSENPDMFLIRLTPPSEGTVFESLIIMNKLRKMEIELDVRPSATPVLLVSSCDPLKAMVNAHVSKQPKKIKELAAVKFEELQEYITVRREEASLSSTTPKFHPTYAFLRLQYPSLRYLPAASSALKQTEEAIPYLSQALKDLASVHWIYAGLRAVAATMWMEVNNKCNSTEYNKALTVIDSYLFCVLFSAEIGEKPRIQPRTLAEQTPDEMLQTTALAADLVSALYIILETRADETEKLKYNRQLFNLYQIDNLITSNETPSRSHYGHRIAVRLFGSVSIRACVGDHPANENEKSIILSVRKTIPWTSSSDSAQTWNAMTRFRVHRRQWLNLAKWMADSQGKDGKPVWAKLYTAKSISESWNPVIASWNNHPRDKNSQENRAEARPDSLDMSAVISVTLNVEQQIRFQVHTFLKRISGTTVQTDSKPGRHRG